VSFYDDKRLRGVRIGCSELLLVAEAKRAGWSFRLLSLYGDDEWLTGWVHLKQPEDLRTARQAKIIRDELGREYRNETDSLLDRAIGVLQDHSELFHVEGNQSQSHPEEENAGNVLHPAGGLTPEFMYEPIGRFRYAYRSVSGTRGVAAVREELGNQEEDSRSKWYISVENDRYYFKTKPEENWLFYTPRLEMVDSWVRGERKPLPIQELWGRTQIYYKTFQDLPRQSEHSILCLFCAQSWLTELLHNVFYVSIHGEYGGGKTATGEALVAPCRHGYQAGNLSTAFLAREVDREKLTLFVDELDSVAGSRDSDLYQIVRQGTRRGGTYARINPETLEKEAYDVFGAKSYSIHGMAEPALQTRSVPIHVRETTEVEYPVIGGFRVPLGHLLAEDWWLWYMENALELARNPQALPPVAQVAQVAPPGGGWVGNCTLVSIDQAAEKARKELFEKHTPLLRNGQLGQLRQLTGRNVELAYLMFVISNLVGVELDADIIDALKQKIAEEAEPREIGLMGILGGVLTTLWEEKRKDPSYLTEAGQVKVSNQELYQRYNQVLKNARGEGVSPSTFRALLTEFGFSDALNRKKMKIPVPPKIGLETRLCNVFDARVLRKLEIEPGGPGELSATNSLPLGPEGDGSARNPEAQLLTGKGCSIEHDEVVRRLRNIAQAPDLSYFEDHAADKGCQVLVWFRNL
jgi:hypothetical protein